MFLPQCPEGNEDGMRLMDEKGKKKTREKIEKKKSGVVSLLMLYLGVEKGMKMERG